jgi:hypothetical protein
VVDPGNFEAAVKIHAEAIASDVAMIGATPTGPSGIYLLDVPVVEKMGEEAGFSPDELRENRKEINEVLTAVGAQLSVDVYVRAVRSREDGETTDEAILRSRYELVCQYFDVARLRQQVWIKQTSKVPNFLRLDWEILEKKVDDDYPPPEGKSVRFALAQVKTVTKNGDEYRESLETFAIDENDLKLITLGIDRLRGELSDSGDDGE